MTAVADAGLVIHLSWIDKLSLLTSLYGIVWIPSQVYNELLAPGPDRPGLAEIRASIGAGNLLVTDVRAPTEVEKFVRSSLGQGESAALVLCQEIEADIFLTDDQAARVAAARSGLAAKGTLGVLRDARKAGLIPSVALLAEDLRRQGQWIGEPIIQRLRQEEGL